jgi:cytochrome c biogenesis factor
MGVVSREIAILMQVILLFAMSASILLGIFYPLFMEIFFKRTISVGEPYFNSVFIPISLAFALLAIFAPFLKWQNERMKNVLKKSYPSLLISLAFLLYLNFKYQGQFSLFLNISNFIFLWLLISGIEVVLRKYFKKEKLSKGFLAMIIAHSAFGLLGLSITLKVSLEKQTIFTMHEGDKENFEGFTIRLEKSEILKSSNYLAQRATFLINNNVYLYPENRIYFPGIVNTYENDIHSTIGRDFYIVMGQPELQKKEINELTSKKIPYIKSPREKAKKELAKNSDEDIYIFPVRIYIKPFITFIWLSVVIMAFGAFLGMLPKKKSA